MNNPKKILLIDDAKEIHVLVTAVLKKAEEFELLTAMSGAEGLAILQSTKPDLIVLDCEMPEMNGIETIHKIKGNESTSDIPVVFLTAHEDEKKKDELLATGALKIMQKPIKIPTFKSELLAILAAA